MAFLVNHFSKKESNLHFIISECLALELSLWTEFDSSPEQISFIPILKDEKALLGIQGHIEND